MTTQTSRLAAAALAALLGSALPAAALAADTPATAAAKADMNAPMVDKQARMKAWTTDKDALEKMLGTGHDKAHYRQELEKAGYYITSVNKDRPDYVEYEIVKGPNSYEVQVNMKDGKSTKVDVTTNVWKAPGTKTALSDKNYKYVYPTAVTREADMVSDSVRGKAWAGEKDKMEKALGVGHDRAYYKQSLEKMGYRITSVNERDPRNLEYEIVKGDTTYEVQVDFDEKTQKSTRVGVSTNMWETPSTERAKGDKR